MKHFLYIFFFLFSIVTACYSQVQFWADDFEGANSTSGTRTPENNGGVGGPPYTSYFCRTPATSTVAQSIAFTSFQGSNYWAGEDHDAAGTGFPGSGTPVTLVREQDITWTGINISGKAGLSFKALLAANSNSTPFDNRNVCNGGATTNTDYLIIQYRIDGGAWSDILRFFTKGSTIEKYLFQETTGDSCGESPQLTNVFTEFNANITGTGTTLDLRLIVHVEGNNEEWGVDNFRLFETSTLPLAWNRFSVKQQYNDALLEWSTLQEQNTYDFIVQHSTNGIEWKDIGNMPANGNSSTISYYSYVHSNPTKGNNFYRIVQRDLDDKRSYSEVRAVKFTGNHLLFSIAGNPVVNGILQVKNNSIINLTFYTTEGKLLWNKQLAAGTHNLDMSNYVKGVYFLKAEGQSEMVLIK